MLIEWAPVNLRLLRSICLALLVVVCLVVVCPPGAHAQTAPGPARQGVAVLALSGATEHAWPLAQKIYASSALRPAALDEAHARVLAGEPPPPDAPEDIRDLAEMRSVIRGDDAPSRKLLGSIASTFSLRAVVVVEPGPPATEPGGAASPPRARLFVADQNAFDAATFTPDAQTDGKFSWDRVAPSIERLVVPKPEPAKRASLAPLPKEAAEKPEESRPFYASGWFWGALGGAAFLGTAIYFATRDSSPGSIHLEVQVPR
jgi:hypothetical protein